MNHTAPSRKSSLMKTGSSRRGSVIEGPNDTDMTPRTVRSRAPNPNGRRSRRVTNIDPNIKITEISKMPRNGGKVVVPDSDKIFNFQCSGTIGGQSQLRGKHVEWRASFNRPIEQFIYPSLQRFDVETYEEKVKQHEKMHGRKHFANYVSPTSSPRAAPPNLSPRSPNARYQDALNRIKLEPLPDALLPQYNENIMYVHAPKWTLRVSEEKSMESDLNEHGYRNTLDEITIEGEKHLKSQIQEHYVTVERDRVERERLGSAGFKVRRRALHHLSVDESIEGANSLYTSLKKQARQTEVQAAMLAHAKQPLYTSETMAFNRLRRDLLNTVPHTHRHLLDGIHYYKYLFESHQAQLEEKKAVEQALMTTVQKSSGKLQSVDSFANRLNRRKQSSIHGASTINAANTGIPVHRSSSIDPLAERDTRDESDDSEDSAYEEETDGSGGGTNSSSAPGTGYMRRLRGRATGTKAVDDDEVNSDAGILQFKEEKFSRVRRAVDSKNLGLGTVGIGAASVTSRSTMVSPSGKVSIGYDSSVSLAASDFTAPLEEVMAKTSKRRAQDLLLLHQLDEGVLPEKFVRTYAGAEEDDDRTSIVLSKFGIGDTRGICLGQCLNALHNLESVGLSDNRLTSASLPTIIENLSRHTLTALDLSFNLLHEEGARALASFLGARTQLQDLDISSCGLTCSDIKMLCDSVVYSPNNLDELRLSCNKIAVDGVRELCGFLVSKTCVLRMLDLSWNSIGAHGAIAFGGALRSNKSLVEVNLASNSIGDYGGQRLVSSLAMHSTMTNFILSQNEIADKSCFVVAQVLKDHPSMMRLDLTFNPLGEAGARSIYRTILRGLKCWVMMGNCSFGDNDNVFNSTYPSVDNPYALDLSEPYDAAVLNELLMKLREDPVNCSFESMTLQDTPKSASTQLFLTVSDKKIFLKSSNQVWNPPESGILKFSFNQAVFVPALSNAIDARSFDILQKIVEAGKAATRRKDVDKKKIWLRLLCQDVFFTTAQVSAMISRFEGNKTIGDGELTKLDVIKCVWKYLLDTENMYTFLYENTTVEQRKDFVYALTLKQYRFNWANPTGSWKLNLGDKTQRSIMMKIIAINNSESEFSRLQSGRDDTSQQGNWFNFRNTKLTSNSGDTQEIVIDKEFIKNLPGSGQIFFDYVSTRRPPVLEPSDPNASSSFNAAAVAASATSSLAAGGSVAGRALQKAMAAAVGAVGIIDDATSVASSADRTRVEEEEASAIMEEKFGGLVQPSYVGIATDDDFYTFLERLGLSTRKKITPADAFLVLMDMQLASAKHYFTVKQVHVLLDTFTDDSMIQSKVIICMFSRIYDLHKMDVLLRNLDGRTQQEVVKRLGYLNVINPLKISFDYVLNLMYLDNRILVVELMELAAKESADQIVEDAASELPIATLYGALGRTKNEVRPEVMRFTFTDFGVRTTNVYWVDRKAMMKKFLVGTQPIDDSTYHVISQYKELDAAGKLTEGPIDQQYLNYQRSLQSTSSKASRTSRKMVNMMRSVSKMK